MRTNELSRKNVTLRVEIYDRVKGYGSMHDSIGGVIDAIIDFAESKGMTPATLRKFRDESRQSVR